LQTPNLSNLNGLSIFHLLQGCRRWIRP